jgi:hypothetical protein
LASEPANEIRYFYTNEMSVNLSARFAKHRTQQDATLNPSISNTVILNSAKSISTSGSTPVESAPTLQFTAESAPLNNYPPLSSAVVIPTSAESQLPKEVQFKLKLLEILVKLFKKDMDLLKNITERTGNIVIHSEDLEELIKILTGASNIAIIASPIVKGCCASAASVLHYQIDRIVVDGFDLHIKYNDTYNFLLANNISLDATIDDQIAM